MTTFIFPLPGIIVSHDWLLNISWCHIITVHKQYLLISTFALTYVKWSENWTHKQIRVLDFSTHILQNQPAFCDFASAKFEPCQQSTKMQVYMAKLNTSLDRAD